MPAQHGRAVLCLAVCIVLALACHAQTRLPVALRSQAPHAVRASRFLAGRTARQAADSLEAARSQHLALLAAQAAQPNAISLSAAWQPVGPAQVLTPAYGAVTGRVTAIAIDPSDATGNTVYLGTTGGGVWKSTNAAGPPASVSFTPLTDTLPVFSANSGSSALPSLSIGAVSVQPGTQNPTVLAGTGDPNDNLDSYYGSGLLRSVDGGSTWTLIQGSLDGVAGNHSFTGLGVAGFAWSTATSGLVVAALSDAAEGDLVSAPDPNNSVRGLYYSTDGGVTWQMATVRDGSQTVQTPLPSGQNQGGNAVTSVVWNSIRARFYAAVRYHGYYESLDGITWTRLTQQPGPSLTLTACPTNPGATGNPACPIFRGALAVQAVTGDLFALTTDGGNNDQGLWQDVCAFSGSSCAAAVSFSQRLVSTPLEQGNGSSVIPQADYNMALAAVPSVTSGGTPDTLLFVGTSDLFRCSLAAGCTLRNTTNATNGCGASAGVAGAQHAIAAISTPSLLYLGNDGGLWRSTDGVNQQATPCSPDDATHFQNLNSGLGSLAEVVSFAQHPTDPNTLLAGFGANGTAGTSSAFSSTAWTQLDPGEGGTVAIDPANPSNWYLSTAPGVSIAHCANGASCTAATVAAAPTIGLTQVMNDLSLIDPPWLIDPAAPSDILIGTCRVWRGPATNSASWNSSDAISPLLSGPQNSSCGTGNSVVRSLATGGPASGAAAAQNAGSTVLYAGMAGSVTGGGSAGGHLFSTTMGGSASSGTSWTDVTSSPVTNGGGQFNPDGFDVSSIAADSHDATGKTVYATIMGFGVAHLYRSTDAGAHWLNISGNLPNAPANSVVVDPNDANTVYVALDTGVYVTQQVATCATTNCWSVYGTSLPNAPIVQLAASASIASNGTFGTLRAATYGRGIWQLPLLTASTPSSQAAITLSPTALTFTPQQVATLSASQTVTVTNTGNAPLTVNSIIVSGDFTQTNNCTSGPIAVNATCTVQVTFQPTAIGARSGLLTVYGNVASGQATATLNGTGTTGTSIVLTPLTLTFPATTTGATSTAQNITISNTASIPATLQSETVSGDFQISANTCGAALPPNTGCTVAIVFTPTASGTRTGSLTVVDSTGTQIASLNGTGNSPATDALSPASLTFTAQQLNTTSAAQQVTLTNSGDVALTLIAAQITSGDFTVVNGCGNSLNARSSCAMQVAFVPKNLGQQAGVLSVSDEFRTQTVALTGTGIAPAGVSLAPFGGLSFAALGIGLTSPAQTVTLTNNGGSTLAITGFAATGDFSIVAGSNTCGAALAVNAACTLQVLFKPTVAAARAGTFTLTGSFPSSPQTLALTGTGVDFSLAASNSTVTVASGSSAVYGLLLTSATGVPGTAVFTCAGAPANSTCLVVPASVPLGTGTATVTVTVATGVSTAALAPASRTFWLAGLLPLGLLLLRKRACLPSLVLFLGASLGLAAASGCGASRTVPPTTTSPTNPTSPTTPSGNSTIVVSASSAGLTRSVNLTLTVQ